ncbi:MAG: hypothetical protein ACR2PL_00970 [Dehalococcoidia bacterium]
MSQRTMERRRVKVSVTLAPELVQEVDRFLREHPEFDRSAIVGEALSLWCRQQQEKAMEEQFAAEPSAGELEERESWRRIQCASAERIFKPPARE